jgi:hypothetical protein
MRLPFYATARISAGRGGEPWHSFGTDMDRLASYMFVLYPWENYGVLGTGEAAADNVDGRGRMRQSSRLSSQAARATEQRMGQSTMSKRCLVAFAAVVAVAATMIAVRASAEVLKKEPPMGALREGQVVLVDDGSCPAGQIKEVTGGNHVAAGGFKRIVRTHRCVPR